MKCKLLSFCAVILVFWFTSTTSADPVWVHDGFLTGNTYLEMPGEQRRAYSIGVIDGIFLGPLFKAPKSEMTWIEDCVIGMSNFQVEAIVAKYLREHPEQWHDPMHAIVFSAMKNVCP